MQWAERIGRRIKLRDLHILLTVMQSGSMGRAASALSVSQPAISKAIADLEYALGVRLLDRSPQGVEPTPYGRTLLTWGIAAFEDLRQGVKALEALADPGAGELRIGATEPLAAGLLPTLLDTLAKQHPRAQFHVVTADRVTLLERELRQRKVDLIITPTEGLHIGADVKAEPLFDDVHIVVAGASSRWVRRKRVKLAQLIEEPWVLPPIDSSAGASIAQAFRNAGVEPPRACVTSLSVPLLTGLLATGRYLTLLPVSVLSLARHLPLRAVPLQTLRDHRPTAILTLKGPTAGPLREIFLSYARSSATSGAFLSTTRRISSRLASGTSKSTR